MELHKGQLIPARENKRYKVLKAGRRGGKTTYQIEEIKFALFAKETRNLYLANTEGQSKNIVWAELKKDLPSKYFKESELVVEVDNKKRTKSTLHIGSWKKREMYRGMSFDNIFFDEIDTMINFLRDWEDIFRPTLADRLGKAYFAGTPKITNPNLKRLENQYGNDKDWGFYYFTAYDNPQIDNQEIENAKKTLSEESFQQEWLAKYSEENLAIFKPNKVTDIFSNPLHQENPKMYLSVDPAGRGKDYNTFTIWKGWELLKIIKIQTMTYDAKVQKIRELQQEYQIPMSQVVIDGVGIGEDLATSPQLQGSVLFKSNFKPFKTVKEITALDSKGNVRLDKLTSDFQDLRAQCVYYLAGKVNKNEILVSEKCRNIKEEIEQELLVLVEAENKSKVTIIPKDELKTILGRSPDVTDTMIMRSYFDIRDEMSNEESLEEQERFNHFIDRKVFDGYEEEENYL